MKRQNEKMTGTSTRRNPTSLVNRLWPMSPTVVAMTLLPYVVTSSSLINKGYTIWFYWNSFFFLLTQNKFLCKFLALQGLSVTFAWYASLLWDWYVCSGRQFGRILYWNMPSILTRHMFQNQELTYTIPCWICMLISHVLDLVGHPILSYYFWKRTLQHVQEEDYDEDYDKEKKEKKNARISLSTSSSLSICQYIDSILTWPVIISTYILSRSWSGLNTWYNDGRPSLFYFGYDVYVILDKEAWVKGMWLPAYIMEGVIYLVIIGCKLRWSSSTCRKPLAVTTTQTCAPAAAAAAAPSIKKKQTVALSPTVDTNHRPPC